MRQLTGQDNNFLELETLGLPQHFTSVTIFDQSSAPGGLVRFKQILALLESRLHLSSLFRSKLHRAPLDLDRPNLVDDPDFDLEYHVRHIAVPQPGDWRQLCILVARINSRPLDLSRPLWELYVIEGLDKIAHVPPGSFALLMKLHHCVMDGVSAAEMMAALHDVSPTPRIVDPAPPRTVESPPSALDLAGRAYLNALRKPRRFVDLGRRILGTELAKKRLDERERGRSAERRVLTRFNDRPISPHRVVDAVSFDFEGLRSIKNALPGATINDVMLAIVSGALRRFLASHDELPSQSLTCGCPIDVRDDAERGQAGNLIGFMGVDLRTDVEDPAARFEAIHRAATLAKTHARASDVRIPMELMELIPGGIMTLAVRVTAAFGINQTPFNTMLTNVPGPPIQLYFAGARSVEGFGIGPLVPGVGLFHTASSVVIDKRGKMLLGFHACREMMPEPELYRSCLIASHRELWDAMAQGCGADVDSANSIARGGH